MKLFSSIWILFVIQQTLAESLVNRMTVLCVGPDILACDSGAVLIDVRVNETFDERQEVNGGGA